MKNENKTLLLTIIATITELTANNN